jgi:hypothetical protein
VKVFLAVCLLVLAGCGGVRETAPSVKYTEYFIGESFIRDFRLVDGTRCIVVSNHAITCDWNRQ